MKNNTLQFIVALLLLFTIGNSHRSYAQPKKISLLNDFVWGDTDPYKELPEIPEKWKNESAVVIFNNQQHFYTKSTKTLDNYFLNRKIIKLNDKAAVEKFSEFNYPSLYSKWTKTINTWMGIKIIKADGTIKEIDVEKERIAETTDTKTFYYGFIRSKVSFDKSYKLAIPDLEIGDVVDYFFYTHEEYKTSGTYVMEAIETPISSTYPIMDFSLNLIVEHDFFINSKSFNGAPELEDITTKKSKKRHYQLHGKDVPKRESTRWFYPLVEDPSIKYQMAFAQRLDDIDDANAYLSKDEDVIKKKVTEEDLLRIHKKDNYTKLVYNDINKFLKANQGVNKKELVEKVYYYIRHIFRNKYLDGIVAHENSLMHMNRAYKNPVYTGMRRFLSYYCTFLRKQKIPFELIKAKRRYDGTIDDLLIKDNLVTFVKINLDEPLYAYPFSSHTFFNSIPALVEGTEAFSMIFGEGHYKIEKVDRTKLPISNHKDNNIKEEYIITFNEDISEINVKRTSSSIGYNKINIFDTYLQITDYTAEENEKYNTTSFADLLNKRDRKTYDEKFAAYKEKKDEDHLKKVKESVKGEYDFDFDDDSFTHNIMQTGRNKINEPLIVEQEFLIKNDLIKRAGSNYIIEIGKIMGSQIAITEEEMSRTENVYMTYPRSFDNSIVVTIPEGYTVSGFDKFNTTVENETGGFTSKAALSGNTLTITTAKHYKNNYEPKSNWNKMLEFLEAGYQLSQEKILLKKK